LRFRETASFICRQMRCHCVGDICRVVLPDATQSESTQHSPWPNRSSSAVPRTHALGTWQEWPR